MDELRIPSMMAVLAVVVLFWAASALGQAETVGGRLWIWGHPARVYNDSFLRPAKLVSTIEPVEAAQYMGLKNMIFVRYDGKPAAPFEGYYRPFGNLDRVYWSLVAAGGDTSQTDRDAAFTLAEKNKNVVGFILDDFFHEPSEGNSFDPVPSQRIWLADNRPALPVVFTVKLPQPVRCDAVELEQTDWRTGDYRIKEVAVELSANGKAWQEVARGELANRPGAVKRLPFTASQPTEVRLRLLSTHDQQGAMSVGLAKLRLLSGGKPLDTTDWKASASSTYPGFSPDAALGAGDLPERPFRASLSPAELRELRQRRMLGRKLPLMAVIYTGQVKPGARAHVAEVDQLCMWTWRPGDLKHLEANFAALEKLAPGKELFLGCYMYDFHECKALPVALMQRQVELGYQWLKARRIAGMIFLATPNVDVGLDAVEWTRQWVRKNADQPLPAAKAN